MTAAYVIVGRTIAFLYNLSLLSEGSLLRRQFNKEYSWAETAFARFTLVYLVIRSRCYYRYWHWQRSFTKMLKSTGDRSELWSTPSTSSRRFETVYSQGKTQPAEQMLASSIFYRSSWCQTHSNAFDTSEKIVSVNCRLLNASVTCFMTHRIRWKCVAWKLSYSFWHHKVLEITHVATCAKHFASIYISIAKILWELSFMKTRKYDPGKGDWFCPLQHFSKLWMLYLLKSKVQRVLSRMPH